MEAHWLSAAIGAQPLVSYSVGGENGSLPVSQAVVIGCSLVEPDYVAAFRIHPGTNH